MKYALFLAIVICLCDAAAAQGVSDADLRTAIEDCAAHQSKVSGTKDNPEAPAGYEAGWEHCEAIRSEFMRRKNDAALQRSKDIANKLKQ